MPLQPLPWLFKSLIKRINKCSSSGSGSGSGGGSGSGSSSSSSTSSSSSSTSRSSSSSSSSGNQLAIYRRGRRSELGPTENKSSKWPERDSNPEPPDCESDALTTRPRYLL